jgi:hypothetical protein
MNNWISECETCCANINTVKILYEMCLTCRQLQNLRNFEFIYGKYNADGIRITGSCKQQWITQVAYLNWSSCGFRHADWNVWRKAGTRSSSYNLLFYFHVNDKIYIKAIETNSVILMGKTECKSSHKFRLKYLNFAKIFLQKKLKLRSTFCHWIELFSVIPEHSPNVSWIMVTYLH